MSYTSTHGSKKEKRYKFTQLLVGLTTLFGAVLVANSVYDPHNSSAHQTQHSGVVSLRTHTSIPQASTNYSLPVRLQIPKLQVDARVIYVGLNKDGSMGVPTNVIDTGWYKYSALPGSAGTAVIAGHLDGLRGEPGVFSNLNKLGAGDSITVTENNGLAQSFIVRETRSYSQNDQPVEVFHSTSGSHLNLITCTGSWDSSEHRFAKRLIVFSDKAS